MVLSIGAAGRTLAVLAAAIAVAAFLSSRAKADPAFDGLWHVSIVTGKGECESGHRLPVRITNGALENANNRGAMVAGSVGENGQVAVVVSFGSQSAAVTGRLAGRSGSGRWTSDACSGSWSASRQGNGRLIAAQQVRDALSHTSD